MRPRTIFLLFLLSLMTSCLQASDYESDKTSSPSGKYYLRTSVNRTNETAEDYADVIIHLFTKQGNLKMNFNTGAGDANKWAVGWHKTEDTIILFSSDVGNSGYKIENEQLIKIDLNGELDERALELKQEKYK